MSRILSYLPIYLLLRSSFHFKIAVDSNLHKERDIFFLSFFFVPLMLRALNGTRAVLQKYWLDDWTGYTHMKSLSTPGYLGTKYYLGGEAPW